MRETDVVQKTILQLVESRGDGKTICPSEVARSLKNEDWQGLMPKVRAQAIILAKGGYISIYRKGKAVDPDDFKGVYRLGVPQKSD